MLFERFEVPGLAHYSYAIGCRKSNSLVIVDPERNIDGYLQFAKEHNMTITHVLETHVHADYASGAAHLAQKTGAEYCVSKYDEGETFFVQQPHRDLSDGETITIDNLTIKVMHTPGHTPEHISFLLFTKGSDTPSKMLSGDFVFVGSLGRPDLLGDAATRSLAEKLWQSVQKLKALPDELEIWPAHGAGSFCGSGMGSQPSTTLGAERLSNPYLNPKLTEEQFIERISTHVPIRPAYYTRMKKLNSVGPKKFETPPGLNHFGAKEAKQLLDDGAVAIDLRKQAEFAEGHIPNAFGIGLGPSLAVWASLVVPYETKIVLVPGSPHQVEEASRMLIRVGLDDIVGHLEDGMETWYDRDYPVDEINLMSPREVQRAIETGSATFVDVRHDDEFASGHAPGALHVVGEYLPERLDQLPDHNTPIAVTCRSGYRSVVAASVLKRAGFKNVSELEGGMNAWMRAGLPIERENLAEATS